MKKLLSILWISLLVSCGAEDTDSFVDEDTIVFDGKADSLGLTSAEVVSILELVNKATFEELDDDARLDVRAVHHIFAYRLGPDAIAGTRDDKTIDNLEVLLSLKWVGARALEKLRIYVNEQGLQTKPCVIISEYIEGQGNNNKGVELLNCGEQAISLYDIGICTIFNGNQTCTRSAIIGDMVLEPWDVVTFCRTRYGTMFDPFIGLRETCQIEMPGVMHFTGDDRLVVFRDLDQDGKFTLDTDDILDIFGMPLVRPDPSRYGEVGLRRTRLFPSTDYATRTWNDRHWFSRHNRHDFSHFGIAPERP